MSEQHQGEGPEEERAREWMERFIEPDEPTRVVTEVTEVARAEAILGRVRVRDQSLPYLNPDRVDLKLALQTSDDRAAHLKKHTEKYRAHNDALEKKLFGYVRSRPRSGR